ncbi:YkvA family protein [Alkalihalobacterium bogoriense]|uniref:YkvA family protein n=1 Tax=Alkalihalobacterium bogoriense TaxID=246272 RepID=UPI000687C3CC|nr:YkvA family protein [Alkalihalobacterium bogoriense]
MEKIKAWAKKIKQQLFVLYFAYKDERVPWYAKVFTICVVAYAFSPIDLIPDFIPILGYVDDVILVPLGILLALKMIPNEVILECEVKAKEMINRRKPQNWIVGSLIILLWSIIMFWVILKVFQLFSQLRENRIEILFI